MEQQNFTTYADFAIAISTHPSSERIIREENIDLTKCTAISFIPHSSRENIEDFNKSKKGLLFSSRDIHNPIQIVVFRATPHDQVLIDVYGSDKGSGEALQDTALSYKEGLVELIHIIYGRSQLSIYLKDFFETQREQFDKLLETASLPLLSCPSTIEPSFGMQTMAPYIHSPLNKSKKQYFLYLGKDYAGKKIQLPFTVDCPHRRNVKEIIFGTDTTVKDERETTVISNQGLISHLKETFDDHPALQGFPKDCQSNISKDNHNLICSESVHEICSVDDDNKSLFAYNDERVVCYFKCPSTDILAILVNDDNTIELQEYTSEEFRSHYRTLNRGTIVSLTAKHLLHIATLTHDSRDYINFLNWFSEHNKQNISIDPLTHHYIGKYINFQDETNRWRFAYLVGTNKLDQNIVLGSDERVHIVSTTKCIIHFNTAKQYKEIDLHNYTIFKTIVRTLDADQDIGMITRAHYNSSKISIKSPHILPNDQVLYDGDIISLEYPSQEQYVGTGHRPSDCFILKASHSIYGKVTWHFYHMISKSLSDLQVQDLAYYPNAHVISNDKMFQKGILKNNKINLSKFKRFKSVLIKGVLSAYQQEVEGILHTSFEDYSDPIEIKDMSNEEIYQVKQETVSVSTGLSDKHDIAIYNNDILAYEVYDNDKLIEIEIWLVTDPINRRMIKLDNTTNLSNIDMKGRVDNMINLGSKYLFAGGVSLSHYMNSIHEKLQQVGGAKQYILNKYAKR